MQCPAFRLLAVGLISTLALSTASLAKVEAPARQAASIPFDFSGKLVRLPVRINGQGPYNLILDTGANLTVLDSTVAAELGLKLGKEKRLGEGYGKSDQPTMLRHTELKELELGDLHAEAVSAVVTDLGRLRLREGGKVDGILGYSDVMHDRVVEIDYPARTVRLFRRSSEAEQNRRPSAGDVLELPFTFRDGFLERLAGMHAGPKVQGTVNGQKVWAQFDTGYTGTFLLPAQSTKRLGLEAERERGEAGQGLGAAGKVDFRKGKLQSVTLGELRVDGPPAIFLAPDATGKSSDRNYDVNVGNGFLQQYRVTFDFRKKQLRLEKVAAGSEAAPASSLTEPKSGS